MQAGLAKLAKGKAVHLIPGGSRVRAVLALADVRGNSDMKRQFQVDSSAQPLEQVLFQRACRFDSAEQQAALNSSGSNVGKLRR